MKIAPFGNIGYEIQDDSRAIGIVKVKGPEGLALARKMAAAPEMYAALIQARGALLLDHMVDDNGKPFGTTVVALEFIDKAIAKAEGR